MSGAAAPAAHRWAAFPLDLGWRNVVFALRTAFAAVTALAISYWLDLRDPQWSALTVYLTAQPTAGAVVAKGVYRILGTVTGAAFGLFALALFPDALPFVGMMVLWLGGAIYGAARTRHFVSYGFLLAGYTALLVGYEGAAAPGLAWRIAVDRSGEILVGISCSAAVSLLIFPRYAGDVLRHSLAATFAALAGYGAAAMRPDTPVATFVALRRQMIGQIGNFDALRSFSAFESPAMRANDQAVHSVVREFLGVLAVVRGLFFRLDDFRTEAGAGILSRIEPALLEAVAMLNRLISTESAPALEPLRADLRATQAKLGAAAGDLEALAGTIALEPLANGLLILTRAGDLVGGLEKVLAAEAVVARGTGCSQEPSLLAPETASRADAALQAVRAAMALLLVSVFWASTNWSAGFSAISGLAVIVFITVNQPEPGRIGWPYLAAVAWAVAAAYAAMIVVMPRLEGFDELAMFVAAVLFPVGLVAGTPRFALLGAAFGAFFVSELNTGNRFVPDPQAYANNACGLLLGLAAGLAVLLGLNPIDRVAMRQRARAAAMRAVAVAARGDRPGGAAAGDVFAILTSLLPQLDLSSAADDDFLRSLLGAASTSVELGRLREKSDDAEMPVAAREALKACLAALGDCFGALAVMPAARIASLAGVEASVEAGRAALGAVAAEPGSAAARAVLRAAASLRFVADRFVIDRTFYLARIDDTEGGRV